tara:strand:- start:1534 stop:1725 length:192 start_codon:yes stop_codon:yes gene_type:complete
MEFEVKEEEGKKIYGLLFHYNYHKKEWACFESGDKENYFNGTTPYKIIGRGKTVQEAYEKKIL